MTPKKVWGLICIVLGVLMFIGGGSDYYHSQRVARLYMPEVKNFSKNIDKALGTNLLSREIKIVEREIRKSYAMDLIACLLGICLSIIGTYMIRTPPENRIIYDDPEPIQVNERGGRSGWKL